MMRKHGENDRKMEDRGLFGAVFDEVSEEEPAERLRALCADQRGGPLDLEA